MTESAHPPGTVIAQRLEVVRALGVGGMGAVYEVEHRLTRHRRALKLLHAEVMALPGVVERFLREASAAGRIGNPHIVETFDAGTTEDGEPYLVMELLRGAPLSGRLHDKGRLEPAEVLEIFTQVCDGVQAAHDSGIVHRDLKPENIFLVSGSRVFVKILDFGISKFDPALTGTPQTTVEGSLLGTPYYMPPEQVRGARDLDASADVYALGVVLYECLIGRRPFEADTLTHLAVLISEGNYVRPTEACPELPREIDAVIGKALAADRRVRYRTAREFSQALVAALAPAALGGMRTEYVPSMPPPGAYSTPPPAPPSGAPGAFSNTPAPYSNPPQAPYSNMVAPAGTLPQGGRALAGTPAPVETTPRATRSVSRTLVAAALVVAAAAIVVAVATVKRASVTPEHTLSAAPPPAPTLSATAAAHPTVSPSLEDPKPADSTAAGAPTTSASAMPRPAGSARAAAHPDAKAGQTRRSAEHGLVETNPFQ